MSFSKATSLTTRATGTCSLQLLLCCSIWASGSTGIWTRRSRLSRTVQTAVCHSWLYPFWCKRETLCSLLPCHPAKRGTTLQFCRQSCDALKNNPACNMSQWTLSLLCGVPFPLSCRRQRYPVVAFTGLRLCSEVPRSVQECGLQSHFMKYTI